MASDLVYLSNRVPERNAFQVFRANKKVESNFATEMCAVYVAATAERSDNDCDRLLSLLFHPSPIAIESLALD